jgi:hypothetical protein
MCRPLRTYSTCHTQADNFYLYDQQLISIHGKLPVINIFQETFAYCTAEDHRYGKMFKERFRQSQSLLGTQKTFVPYTETEVQTKTFSETNA